MWLLFNESRMSKREQELKCVEKGKELRDVEKIDRCLGLQQENFEDELDDNFWIKVMKVWCFLKVDLCE